MLTPVIAGNGYVMLAGMLLFYFGWFIYASYCVYIAVHHKSLEQNGILKKGKYSYVSFTSILSAVLLVLAILTLAMNITLRVGDYVFLTFLIAVGSVLIVPTRQVKQIGNGKRGANLKFKSKWLLILNPLIYLILGIAVFILGIYI